MHKLNIFLYFLLFFLNQGFSNLFGLDVRHCYIKDWVKHESNQKLLKNILEQELALHVSNGTPFDQAKDLMSKITQIASEMLKHGFSADAYEIPELGQNSVVSFSYFPLWEGGKAKNPIPLTFFVYVWPSEKIALKNHSSDPLNCRYGTVIHCHPIPCAFAVLKGALIQNNYEEASSYSTDRKICFINEDVFLPGEGDVDDLKKQFIHRLYNRGTDSKVSLSVHAYGLPTAEKVKACFYDTFFKCAYQNTQVVFQ